MITNFFTFSRFTLLIALCISTIAAYYSVVGLTAIFAGAVIPIMIMGGILEVAKITTTVWLHRYWSLAGMAIRSYLTLAVVALACLTSMGIFGLLSKAHLDHGIGSKEVQSSLLIIDEKIKTQRENIETARKSLAQMDEQVNQRLSRGANEQGAERSVQIRRQQTNERNILQREISIAQKEITKLNEERMPISTKLSKAEAEVGPVKYIAALIYGDNPDVTLLERAVRWIIIVIVVVFDPLAIILILAANNSIKWDRERREKQEMLDNITEVNSEPPRDETVEPIIVEEIPEVDEVVQSETVVAAPVQADQSAWIHTLDQTMNDLSELIQAANNSLKRERADNASLDAKPEIVITPVTETRATAEVPTTSSNYVQGEYTGFSYVLAGAPVDSRFTEDVLNAGYYMDVAADEPKVLDTEPEPVIEYELQNEEEVTPVVEVENTEPTMVEAVVEAIETPSTVTEIEEPVKQELPVEEPTVSKPAKSKRKKAKAENIETENVTVGVNMYHPMDGYVTYEGKLISITALREIRPDLILSENSSQNEILFGSKFPKVSRTGDIYIRVENTPHQVFKFDGSKWMELDKDKNTSYLQNTAYLQYLISKLDSNEYDLDLLTSAEQDEISEYLSRGV